MRLQNFILLSLYIFLLSSCKTGVNQDSVIHKGDGTAAIIEFEELEYDFGKVAEGEKVGWYFKYKNTGGSDLVILNVITTCGCTAPHYSKKPLPAGEEDFLQIIFNSSGKNGKEIKNVKIESNALNNIVNLKLIFEVIN